MYILFLLFWIIFNGAFTWEILIFGLVISAAIYAFICIFMGFSFKKDILMVKRLFLFIGYIFVLIWEIIKANITMARIIVVKQEYELHPVLFKYRTGLKSKTCRVLLANSITLTPGTISVSLVDDTLIINAIDQSLGFKDDGEFLFEKLLRKVENPDA